MLPLYLTFDYQMQDESATVWAIKRHQRLVLTLGYVLIYSCHITSYLSVINGYPISKWQKSISNLKKKIFYGVTNFVRQVPVGDLISTLLCSVNTSQNSMASIHIPN